MKFLQLASDRVKSYRAFFVDLIRIYLGVGLAIKGVFFLLHPETLRTGAASLPPALVGMVPYIHLAGGILLAVGLVTRVAALIQIPVVAGALVAVNLPRMTGMAAREAFEFSALTLLLLVLIALWGGGPLSLDHKLRTKASPMRTETWFSIHPDLFLDLVRAYLGIGLFVKGLYILDHQSEFQKLIENTGTMPLSLIAVAHYVIPVHFVAGVMLFLGLATRYAAIAQIPLLIGAIFYVYLPRFATLELRQNMEFTGLVLFLLCVFAVCGSGRYSLDYIIRNAEARQETGEPVVPRRRSAQSTP
jgi:putative oxidoreductase